LNDQSYILYTIQITKYIYKLDEVNLEEVFTKSCRCYVIARVNKNILRDFTYTKNRYKSN